MGVVSESSGGPPPGWPSPPEPPRAPAKTVVGEPVLVDGAPVFPGLEDAHGSAPHGPALEAPSGPLPTFVDMPASEGPPTNFGPPPYSDVVPDARANDAFAAPMPEGLHPQPNLGLTPPLPDSGSRRVAATLVDDGSLAPLPAPAYGPPPQAYGGHPSPYVAGPPMHGPMAPQRPAGSARRGGPPLVAIGVAAAVLLGGALTLAFWLKARGSSAEAADAQPLLPTPAVATVASDPPLPGAGDPPIDPAAAPVPPRDPGSHGRRDRCGLPQAVPRARRRPLRDRVRQRGGPAARLLVGAAQDDARARRSPTAIQIYGSDPERLAEAARWPRPRARVHRRQLRLLGAEDRGARRGRRLAARARGDGRHGEDGRGA
jgi:hypothetical protein